MNSMYDKDKEKEPADLSARLEESELLKPGTAVKPGSTQPVSAGEQNQEPHKPDDIQKDVAEFNNFVAAQEEAAQEIEQPKNGTLHVIWEIAKTILIAAAVVIFINTFVFQAYYVSGTSMTPTYQDKDYLLVNKFPTTWRNILKVFGKKDDLNLKRGEVLVFRPPENPEIFYIKRVIGLPGDRVVLKNGVYTIDEVVLPGNVFVSGDNRSPGGSYDSRAWGQLQQDKIIGDAFFRLIPLNSIGFISNPDYQNSK